MGRGGGDERRRRGRRRGGARASGCNGSHRVRPTELHRLSSASVGCLAHSDDRSTLSPADR